MRVLKYFFTWFFALFRRKNEIDYRFVEDVPDHYANNILYIVGEGDSWLLTMRCPCSCGRIIKLNTLKDAKPCWKYYFEANKITIQPSVWGVDGCRSHFFIRKGSVKWVDGAGV